MLRNYYLILLCYNEKTFEGLGERVVIYIGESMQYRKAKLVDASLMAAILAQSWRDTYIGLLSDDFLDNEVQNLILFR